MSGKEYKIFTIIFQHLGLLVVPVVLICMISTISVQLYTFLSVLIIYNTIEASEHQPNKQIFVYDYKSIPKKSILHKAN